MLCTPLSGSRVPRRRFLSEITYALGKRVRVEVHHRNCVLVMGYPLKAVRIPTAVSHLFHYLAAHGESPLEDLAGLVPKISKDSLENLLDRMEKAGWVKSRGVIPMSPLPKVSIIVPVRNRPEEIASCVKSLLSLDYPEEKREIIVVDDASEDDTPRVVEGLPVTRHRMRERQGPSACRNWGARHSNGEMVCFLDSDCVAKRSWLRDLVPAFRRPMVGAAGGLVDSHDDRTALDRYEKVKSSLHMGNHPTDSSMGNRFFYLPSCNLAVRKETFLKVGGFEEGLEVGEDVDLCWRIIDMGRVVEYRPSAEISHKHRNSIWPFCKRRFEYGTSEPLLQELHPNRVKTFLIWPKSLVFWSLCAAAILLGAWSIGFMAVAWLMGDAVLRQREISKVGVRLNILPALAAVLRSNASFLYHCGSFVSRYYLGCATLLAPVYPMLAAVAWALHLGVGTVEFLVKKPRLNLVSFLGLFSLEQLSYQTGVWFGCVRDMFFLPLFPRISAISVAESKLNDRV